MEIVAGMLKRDQQSLVKRVADLESAMDQQVNKIKVQSTILFYVTFHCVNNIISIIMMQLKK